VQVINTVLLVMKKIIVTILSLAYYVTASGMVPGKFPGFDYLIKHSDVIAVFTIGNEYIDIDYGSFDHLIEAQCELIIKGDLKEGDIKNIVLWGHDFYENEYRSGGTFLFFLDNYMPDEKHKERDVANYRMWGVSGLGYPVRFRYVYDNREYLALKSDKQVIENLLIDYDSHMNELFKEKSRWLTYYLNGNEKAVELELYRLRSAKPNATETLLKKLHTTDIPEFIVDGDSLSTCISRLEKKYNLKLNISYEDKNIGNRIPESIAYRKFNLYSLLKHLTKQSHARFVWEDTGGYIMLPTIQSKDDPSIKSSAEQDGAGNAN